MIIERLVSELSHLISERYKNTLRFGKQCRSGTSVARGDIFSNYENVIIFNDFTTNTIKQLWTIIDQHCVNRYVNLPAMFE